MDLNTVKKLLKKNWKFITVILVPILMSFLLIWSQDKQTKCGIVILVMAFYWATEALPLPVTALIPVLTYPMLGILSTDDVSKMYMGSSIIMFMAAFMVATAVEVTRLHERIALFIILKVGQSPRKLMWGFMGTTMFLSMWISNTASTSMMIPIIQEVFKQLDQKVDGNVEENNLLEDQEGNSKEQKERTDIEKPIGNHQKKKEDKMLNLCLLATAYSANLGGTGFPTGTGPNIVLLGLMDKVYGSNHGLSFGNWMLFNVPTMIICAIILSFWLEFYFMGFKAKLKTNKEEELRIKTVVERSYKKLGKMTSPERNVLIIFVLMILLWITKNPKFIQGWEYYIQKYMGETGIKIGNATPAILAVLLLFIASAVNIQNTHTDTHKTITWNKIQDLIPWGILILIGGGLAIAEAADKTGLSYTIGQKLKGISVLPSWATLTLCCILVAFITEVVSNTTTASIFLPILIEINSAIGQNPLYMLMPVTISTSYAFMMPVATPPNALVATAGGINTKEMMKVGFALNFTCIFVMLFMIHTWGYVAFDLGSEIIINNSTAAV